VIDAASRTLSLDVSDRDLQQRLAAWTAPAPRYAHGVFAKYAQLVSSASAGAVTGW
jgi:dihydroxy-acid dehydratase